MSLIGTCSLVDASARNLRIKYELKNTTDKTLYVCQYYTPFEYIKNSQVFSIYNTTTNCEIEYHGVMAKRARPTAEYYKKIEPNETISNTLGLDSAFSFEPNQTYSITATTNLLVIDNLNNLDSRVSVPCTCNTLSVTTV